MLSRWVLLTGLALILAAWVWEQRFFFSTQTNALQSGWQIVRDVPRITEENFLPEELSHIRATRIPVILANACAVQSTPLSKFDYLEQEFPWAIVYKQTNRAFATFHDNKDLEGYVKEQWNDFNIMVNVSMADVLAPEESKYYYFSSSLSRLSRPSVRRNLLAGGGPSLHLNVSELLPPLPSFFDGVSNRKGQSNLWVGKKGLITHTHFDAQDNFFVQLKGKKRFTLFSPLSSSSLAFYPCLHPHSGHLFSAPSALALPSPASSIETWTAELEEGEVLYIPPYWWHHVETLQNSVSVNMWMDADEALIMDSVYSSAIPFELSWPRAKMLVAVHAYIFELLSQLRSLIGKHKFPEPLQFMSELFATRWERLELMHQRGDLMALCAKGSLEQAVKAARIFYTSSTFTLQRGLDVIVPLLTNLYNSSARSNDGVVNLLTGNYIEHLIGNMLGYDSVRPFLEHCFRIL